MTEKRLSRSKAGESLMPAPIFVLDHPQMGENIGASARGMLNFGVHGLRLVAPRDGWPNPKATATASGASAVIDGARVFEAMDDALADTQFVLATTARRRELSLPVMTPAEAAMSLRERVVRGETCAVIFGGERNGLASEDVARADAIISIPVNPAFASLNLSQAVLLIAYEWAQTEQLEIENPMAEETLASRDSVIRLYTHLEQELDKIGYFYPAEMRETLARTLRVALTRAGFTESETRTLRGVIKALVRGRG